ncbi:hypothetical protein HY994_03105 [Candidatus Micrarchaeota archaeon]|nr:hypothetical protein [Candidatus Micrarchaeota archaeon]
MRLTEKSSSNIRGQGTFEYVLLLGGVLLIVVLALVVLQSSFFQTATGVSDVQLKQCKASAQQATACYDSVTIFNGSKTFDMLGYAANPLLCNCSDYNPDAFTVSVGTTGLTELGFSSQSNQNAPSLFSSLSFDDAPADADAVPTTSYAFSVTLPPGKYQFFLILADRTVNSLEVQTVTTAADGRLVYSWDSLPSGSRVKVNPIRTKVSEEEKSAAKNEKTQIPSASELEKQAGSNSQNKDVKTGWNLKLLTAKDGKLRAIYTYAPTEDYADAFSMTVPIAANRILKTHPASSTIVANAEDPEASDVSWDKVSLNAGIPFRVIVELKPDAQDASTLSSEVDAAIGKIKNKNLALKKGKSKDDCFFGLLCQSKNTPTPTPSVSPSLSVGENPSASANPSTSTNPIATAQAGSSEFIAIGQGCASTSLLPGSIDKKCVEGSICQIAGGGLFGFMTWKCLPDKNAPTVLAQGNPCELGGKLKCAEGLSCIPDKTSTTAGLSCQKPGTDTTPSPTLQTPKRPPLDLGSMQIEESTPWEWYDVKELESPTPTPVPKIAIVADAPQCTQENREPIEAACCSGLDALAEDPHLPNSRLLCQKPENAKVYQAPLTEWRFESDPVSPQTDSGKLLPYDVPLASLLTSSKGVGTGVPKNGFIRDENGHLYLVVQKPVVKYVTGLGNSWYLENNLAVSKDNGKSWNYLSVQSALPETATYDVTSETRTASAPKYQDECLSQESVPTVVLEDLFPENPNLFVGACYTHFCKANDDVCKKQYFRCDVSANSRDLRAKFSEASTLYDQGFNVVACATGPCYCNPPIVSSGTTNVCIQWSYKPVTEQVCIRTEGGVCVETEDVPMKPVSYALKHYRVVYSGGEFEGIAPAKGGGAYLFYRVLARDLYDGTEAQNRTELHVMAVDSEGKSTDSVLDRQIGINIDRELRFAGASGTSQFFTKGDDLFLSQDGGLTRLSQKARGALAPSGWREYVPAYCSSKSYIPPLDVWHPFDIVKPQTNFHVVAGGHLVSVSGNQLVLLQQDDGYFLNPSYVTYPQDFDGRFASLYSGYLSHPVLDKAFYLRMLEKQFGYPYSTSVSTDADGGLHLAFASQEYDNYRSAMFYYQYYPPAVFDRSLAKDHDRVILFNRPDCPACEQVSKWLLRAGVNFQQGGTLPLAVQEKADALMKQGKYPLTVVGTADEYELVVGNDSIRLSLALDAVLDPVLVARGSTQNIIPAGGYVHLNAALQMYVAPGNQPVLWMQTRSVANELEQYTYHDGEFVARQHPIDLTRPASPKFSTSMTWDRSATQYSPNYFSYYLGDLNPNPVFYPASVLFASSERVSDANLSATLVYQSTDSAGRLAKDSPITTDKSEGLDNQYSIYIRSPTPNVLEPEAGSILNELVPFQTLRLPIPFSADAAPTLTFKSNLNDVVFAKVVPSDDDSYSFDVELTLDARKYLEGGKLDVSVDAVEGKLTVKTKDNSAELPFKVSVKHVAPENLAYVTPETLVFYTNGGNGVAKPVFLTNNYNRPLTLSCGALFSRVLVPGTVTQVDLKPPASTTECTVALDGVATRQVFKSKVIPLSAERSFTERDLLSEVAPNQAAVSFRDCSDFYCDCKQSRQAVDHFKELVKSHVRLIGSSADRDAIKQIYPSGWKEAVVLRTGVFDDLEKPDGLCTVNFDYADIPLESGQVYQLKLSAPSSQGWLSSDHLAVEKPIVLLPRYSYAVQGGIESKGTESDRKSAFSVLSARR